MDTLFESFHFARPLWFLAIIPTAIALYYFVNQVRSAQLWSKHISPELLSQLTDKQTGTGKSLLFAGLVSGLLLLLIIALAGPSLKSENVQTLQTDDTLVVILDLSLSMMAEDVKPSRLQRMKFKLQDLLEKRKTGYTALVVYSGDAHVVVPLTEDTETIKHLAKSLSPWMIPSKGSRLHRAMEEANNLLEAYPSSNSRILLFTDEISEQQLDQTLAIAKYPTYVIGVGTTSGAPIPLPDGKLLKDNKQNIVITKFIDDQPKTLAKETGGSFRTLSVDDSDISDALSFQPKHKESSEDLQKLAAVKDYGYLLLIPAFFMMILSFRKGWLLAVGLIVLQPIDSYATQAAADDITSTTENYENSVWDQLWLNQSQRAQKAYDMKDYTTASKLFDDPIKKADAYAKNKQWQEAESTYQGLPSATAKYNLANVQAQQGKWEQAEKSYDQAIEAAKSENRQDILERALKDKNLIEQLKKQQQSQENQQQNGQEGQNQDQQNSENQDGNENQDGQPSDSQQENNQQQDGQQGNQSQNDPSQSDSGSSEQNGSDSQAQQNESQQNRDQSQNAQQESQSSPQNQGASDQESQSGQNDANLNEQQAQSAAEKAEQNQDAMSQSQSADAHDSEEHDSEEQGASSQAAQTMQDKDQQGVEDYGNAAAMTPTMEPSPEDVEEQKYQQILRKVQSDPSILLENKFRIQHYQRNKPENEAQVW